MAAAVRRSSDDQPTRRFRHVPSRFTRFDFHDGTIEVGVAGSLPNSARYARFRRRCVPHRCGQTKAALRGTVHSAQRRAEDQVRRNHSTYFSYGLALIACAATHRQYESYADLVPGEWTHLRIEVLAHRALYVSAAQPVLVVRDLKRGADALGVWLWVAITPMATSICLSHDNLPNHTSGHG